MAIMRPNPPTRNYGKHSHTWARDSTLSSKAKAILLSICSHAGNYDLTVKQIVSEVAEGYDAVNAGIRELETRGIIKRTRRRTSAGTLGGYDWIVIDPPEPAAGGDQSGNSATGRDQEEQDVSAAQDQSGISGTGGDQGKDGDCAGGDQSRKSRTGDDQQEQGVSAGGNQSGISGPKKIKDSQEEDQKSLSGEAPPSVPAPRVSEERERDEDFSQNSQPQTLTPPQRLIAKRVGNNIDTIDFVLGFIKSANGINGDGWWFTADRNGSLDAQIARALEAKDRGGTAGTCRRCNGSGKHLADTMYGTTEVDCQCQWQATERCPIHMGNKALACAGCWGDVKSGMDPYRGRERERPGGWYDVYHRDRQPRSGQRGTGVYRNPANQDEYDEWLRRPGPQVHMDPPERSRGIVGAVASELLAAHGINRDQEGPT